MLLYKVILCLFGASSNGFHQWSRYFIDHISSVLNCGGFWLSDFSFKQKVWKDQFHILRQMTGTGISVNTITSLFMLPQHKDALTVVWRRNKHSWKLLRQSPCDDAVMNRGLVSLLLWLCWLWFSCRVDLEYLETRDHQDALELKDQRWVTQYSTLVQMCRVFVLWASSSSDYFNNFSYKRFSEFLQTEQSMIHRQNNHKINLNENIYKTDKITHQCIRNNHLVISCIKL